MTPTALCEAIHRAGVPGVLACTGGGASAGSMLLGVPGASRSVLEVIVPYAEGALVAFLGRRPESFCSTDTARLMAERAFARARRLAPGVPVWGLGCTASLVSDRPKRGDHRVHIGVRTLFQQINVSLTLAKGARDRAGEEAVAAALVLKVIADAAGVVGGTGPAALPGEEAEWETHSVSDPLTAFLRGDANVPAVCAEPDGRCRADGPKPAAILPGSFNPLHAGHTALAAAASRKLGVPVAFELSVTNADKPEVAPDEVLRRLAAFAWRAPVWLTRAPTFVAKSGLFPSAVMVVGADTAARIVAPRFYGDSVEQRDAAMATLQGRGCRFLVAGRADAAGGFVGLERCGIPPEWGGLFEGLSEGEFRVDLSSTQLRQAST